METTLTQSPNWRNHWQVIFTWKTWGCHSLSELKVWDHLIDSLSIRKCMFWTYYKSLVWCKLLLSNCPWILISNSLLIKEICCQTLIYIKNFMASIYLIITKPDFSFPVHNLVQFMQKPTTVYMQTTKKVLRYLLTNPAQGTLLTSNSAALLRDKIIEGSIITEHVPYYLQLVDILTNLLFVKKHNYLMSKPRASPKPSLHLSRSNEYTNA